MRILADGNLLAGLNVFDGKEDGDTGSFVVDGVRIRLARVIHSGDSHSDGFRSPTLSMLAPFQSIFDEFLLQSVAFWSEISDSCIQIIVNNKYRSNSTWNKKYYTWDIIWRGENRFDNGFQCRKKQYLSSESFVWNGDLSVHVLFSTTVTCRSFYDTS